MPDLTIVLAVLFINFREALVYFSLACIAGLLVFTSCILGQYLSDKLAPTPTPHGSRAMSLRSRRSCHDGEYSQLHGPGPPMLGSWTRPSTLNMDCKGTMPSPWTVNQTGVQWGRHGMMAGSDARESDSSYPWVFYDANTKEKKAVIYSQALYQRENISVV
eukprot:TRINITY_DN19732_c0_g1_i1.p1 TRINITY_DN19732_c0_g1~~TRINITY_DN19732_c0_g1_i1.p1  ORF type:complete len:161 (-),score=38.39 TRINITY_DN19732_c0_g1_i1:78-560(-)